MGDTHMFEGSRSQRSTAMGGRNVLPPRDRESQHLVSTEQKVTTSVWEVVLRFRFWLFFKFYR